MKASALILALCVVQIYALVHPGILVSKAQLDYVKSKVKSQSEPFYSAFQKAEKYYMGSLTYKPKGPPSDGIIECGSYSNPNIGCSDDDDDSSAAYLQSLLWYITGNNAYAKNVITLLNLYSKLKQFTNSNAPLQAGWSATKWVRAAEMMKHLNSSWSAADATAFQTMLYKAHLPLIKNGSRANGNWELAMIEGMMNIAIFSDDADLFNHSVTFWKERVPAYLYYEPIDGSHYVKAPRGDPSWYGQTTFNAEVNGIGQETCRDFGHLQFGLASTLNAAETARIQGVDLFSAQKERIPAAMEFHAKYLLGAAAPSYVCDGKIDITQRPTFEIGYNAYHNRLGLNLPNTLAQITKNVRTMSTLTDNHIVVWETLTHGGSPSDFILS